MKLIVFPIRLKESSSNVANLQAALSTMLPAIGLTDFKIPATELAAQKALDGTRTAIELIQQKFPDNYDNSLLVDELMAKLINDFMSKWFVVKGKLTDSNGQRLSNYTVLILKFDIDKTVEVGVAVTNLDGMFTVSFLYEAKLQNGDGDTNPDLCFKVTGSFGQFGLPMPFTKNAEVVFIIENGVETAIPRLADSEKAPIVLMNCQQEMEVRIMVTTAQSKLTEFELLITQLLPLMGERIFADLKEDEDNFQISFLSKKKNIPKLTIENLKNAFTNERDNNIPAWAFFGLSSAQLPMSEWNNKTSEEFIALLQTFKPASLVQDLNALTVKLIAFAKNL